MSAPASNKLKSPALLLALLGFAICGIALVYLFLTPKLYEASARLKVIDWKDSSKPVNEQLVPAECATIRSAPVLDVAIQNLHLTETWARQSQRAALTPDEARQHLKSIMAIRQVAQSSLIDIHVASEFPEETAKIANEIARAYLDLRHTQHETLVREKISALEQEADAGSQKLREAQAELDKIYFEVVKARAAGNKTFYDPDAYALLLSNRVTLEARHVTAESELSMLKKMDRDKLRQVLSSMDTNSLITPALRQLGKAQKELTSAKLDFAADSQQVKDATLVVEKLNERIDEMAAAAMTVKETDLASLKTMLDDLNTRAKSATTNTLQAAIQEARYAKASNTVRQLKDERDLFQAKLAEKASTAVGKSDVVTAELLNPAETPSLPFVPNPTVALVSISVGALAIIAGFILLLISLKPRPPAPKP